MIVKHIPAPKVELNAPFQFQAALLDYNDYIGRIGIGRISKGKVNVNDIVTCVRLDGSHKQFRVQKLYGFLGLRRTEINEAFAGDIVAIGGLEDINVGETICDSEHPIPLKPLHIDPPTLQMTFATNTSPFAGTEGKYVTARKLEERLFKATQTDVSLLVERLPNSESWLVSGRGELHLSILIENMRREGFELQVSKPKVILKEVDGVVMEPYEDLQIDVPEEYVGAIMEALGPRGAELVNMHTSETQVRLNYVIPSRGLLGFSTDFMTLTKGYGLMSHTYKEYRERKGVMVGKRSLGVLVATDAGLATHYAIEQIESRGTLFIEPGRKVYEGMIVGECAYENDLAVNVVKTKNLSNMRSAGKDHTVVLKRPRVFSLEVALDYINDDELVEITPLDFRLRKAILNTNERKKFDSRQKEGNKDEKI
jgi:GTP-binding protein